MSRIGEPRRNAFLLSEISDFIDAALLAVSMFPESDYKRGYHQALSMIAAMTGIDYAETQHRHSDGPTTIEVRPGGE